MQIWIKHSLSRKGNGWVEMGTSSCPSGVKERTQVKGGGAGTNGGRGVLNKNLYFKKKHNKSQNTREVVMGPTKTCKGKTGGR